MADHEDEPDMPSGYHLAEPEAPKRKYIPMKGFRGSSERGPDEFDKPVLKRLIGIDPFPWALAICVLLWVGLGLAARSHPIFCGVLIAAGFLVMLAAQIWLYLSILEDDFQHGVLSLMFRWYRVLYLYMNPEVAWRPSIITGIGVLMSFTGMGMLLTKPWAH